MLIIVNWWRGLTRQEQAEQAKAMKNIYSRPSVSNDKLSTKQRELLATALSTDRI
jgi:hypothetical protein